MEMNKKNGGMSDIEGYAKQRNEQITFEIVNLPFETAEGDGVPLE